MQHSALGQFFTLLTFFQHARKKKKTSPHQKKSPRRGCAETLSTAWPEAGTTKPGRWSLRDKARPEACAVQLLGQMVLKHGVIYAPSIHTRPKSQDKHRGCPCSGCPLPGFPMALHSSWQFSSPACLKIKICLICSYIISNYPNFTYIKLLFFF